LTFDPVRRKAANTEIEGDSVFKVGQTYTLTMIEAGETVQHSPGMTARRRWTRSSAMGFSA
jgi:hypothetical protein